MAIGRWQGTPAGVTLAFYIALGISIAAQMRKAKPPLWTFPAPPPTLQDFL